MNSKRTSSTHPLSVMYKFSLLCVLLTGRKGPQASLIDCCVRRSQTHPIGMWGNTQSCLISVGKPEGKFQRKLPICLRAGHGFLTLLSCFEKAFCIPCWWLLNRSRATLLNRSKHSHSLHILLNTATLQQCVG